MIPDAESAVRATTLLLCVAGFVTTIEQLVSYSRLSLFVSPGLASARAQNSAYLIRLLVASRALLAAYCIACTALFGLPTIGIVALVAIMLVITWIRPVGGDGADQLQLICLTTVALCLLLAGQEAGVHWAALYISFQLLLSYATTGWAKVASPIWRKGNALAGILSTFSYGHDAASKALTASPTLNRVGTWGPMILFSVSPLIFFQPSMSIFMAFLTLAFAFHVGTGLFMGLNNFLITFPATYPCVLYGYSYFHSRILVP